MSNTYLLSVADVGDGFCWALPGQAVRKASGKIKRLCVGANREERRSGPRFDVDRDGSRRMDFCNRLLMRKRDLETAADMDVDVDETGQSRMDIEREEPEGGTSTSDTR